MFLICKLWWYNQALYENKIKNIIILMALLIKQFFSKPKNTKKVYVLKFKEKKI